MIKLIRALSMLFMVPSAKALEPEPLVDCLYNGDAIQCRRTFLCESASCWRFKLQRIDGVSDVFTRVRNGLTRDTGFYKDPRGADWALHSYGPAFVLRNIDNGNTIVFIWTRMNVRFGRSHTAGKEPNKKSW